MKAIILLSLIVSSCTPAVFTANETFIIQKMHSRKDEVYTYEIRCYRDSVYFHLESEILYKDGDTLKLTLKKD